MHALCDLVRQFGPLTGRIFITAIFLISGYHKIIGFAAVSGLMAKVGMPMPDLLLVAAIVCEIAGGLMVLVGWHACWGALALIVFTIPATLVFHNFWAVGPADFQNQFNHFMKNLAIIGGLLYIMAMG
ncbi:MAG TPA: DoxX family protein, partial [Burkholderiales bacterium]|nr:DoxX family protein [Burkholderiales bacterium]